MPNTQKIEEVKNLTELLSHRDVLYILDYKGLTVGRAQELREKFRSAGMSVRVAKNRLIKLALESLKRNTLNDYLQGPTMLVVSESDPVTPAKLVAELTKAPDFDVLSLKGIVVGDDIYGGEKLDDFARMFSEDETKAQLVNLLTSPIRGLVMTLGGMQRKLVYALKAIEGKKEK